jgi:hypothetical protein
VARSSNRKLHSVPFEVQMKPAPTDITHSCPPCVVPRRADPHDDAPGEVHDVADDSVVSKRRVVAGKNQGRLRVARRVGGDEVRVGEEAAPRAAEVPSRDAQQDLVQRVGPQGQGAALRAPGDFEHHRRRVISTSSGRGGPSRWARYALAYLKLQPN